MNKNLLVEIPEKYIDVKLTRPEKEALLNELDIRTINNELISFGDLLNIIDRLGYSIYSAHIGDPKMNDQPVFISKYNPEELYNT